MTLLSLSPATNSRINIFLIKKKRKEKRSQECNAFKKIIKQNKKLSPLMHVQPAAIFHEGDRRAKQRSTGNFLPKTTHTHTQRINISVLRLDTGEMTR